MIPPVTKLLIKIDQLEWDLAEVKKELEKLQVPFMKFLTPEERLAVGNGGKVGSHVRDTLLYV